MIINHYLIEIQISLLPSNDLIVKLTGGAEFNLLMLSTHGVELSRWTALNINSISYLIETVNKLGLNRSQLV